MNDKINYYIFLPAMFLLFFLQTTFFAQVFWGFVTPNLVLIILFAAILLCRNPDILYAAFLLGFLFDIFSGSNFAIFIISFTLSCAAMFYMQEKFLKETNFLKVAGLAIAGILLYNITYLILSRIIFGTEMPPDYNFLRGKIAFDCAYAAFLTYPAMLLISKRKQ